ncbi:MAG TPA: patatin-like phospholipase family protein [Candidatus Kapabacteria bacterium]|nr:patatin-like phospholipase family protein [Candidatus Kapabacteria bacterium]
MALVLSGGGARGLSHIGVLDILDSAKIPVDLIVGTSMGAVVGGLYAAGYSPKELEQIATQTNWQDVLSLDDDSRRNERLPSHKDERTTLLSLRFNGFFNPVLPQAISSGQRLTMLINGLILSSPYGTQENFLKDLKVPFIALATDIVTGSRELITHGDLTAAIRASATIPLRFNPVSHDSAILVDGGLLANVPIDVARDSANASYVIASNTTAELRVRDELNTPWDVADQVITLMMRKENNNQLRRADVVISPDLEHSLPDNFQNAELYIERGREAARRALPALKKIALQPISENIDPPSDQPVLDVVRDIRLYGVHGRQYDSLTSVISGLRGNRITSASLESEIKRPIIDHLRRRGYSLAKIDSIVVYHNDSRLDVFIDPGYIKEIRIGGLRTIKPIIVRDQLPFSEGDVIRSDRCERGLKNLTATGYFSYANIEFIRQTTVVPPVRFLSDTSSSARPVLSADDPPGSTIVQLTVEELATQVLRLGGLADNEFGAQFSMEYVNENVFGLGAAFSAKGGLGGLSRYAVVQISGGPALVNLSTSLYSSYKDISVYSFSENIPNGTYRSTVADVVRELRDIGANAHLGINLGRDASLAGEYRIERQRSYSTQSLQYVSNPVIVSALKGMFTLDRRDDPDYPHSGEYFEGFYEVGTRIFGGELGYTKIAATVQDAIPVSGLHTVEIHASIGVADRTTPRLEQFALGGINSFFGLNEYEYRGKQFALGSLGYQIAIPNSLLFPTFVLFRYDFGAMWDEPTAIKFESFVHGLGSEIGFKTPIGLAKFGLGENFRFAQSQKKPLLLNTPRFYFSIGANL